MDSAKHIKQRITKTLKKHNITCRQAVVLRSLEGVSLSAKKMGEICCIDKATLSSILDKLIANRFVICSQNPEDKRENIYAITDKGLDILPVIASIEAEYKAELLKSMTQDEYDELVGLLVKLNQYLIV
jgi:DNA-binding MarR family transcriptional regulator